MLNPFQKSYLPFPNDVVERFSEKSGIL